MNRQLLMLLLVRLGLPALGALGTVLATGWPTVHAAICGVP